MNALLVDVGNLFYCVGKKFPNRRLDYSKLYDIVHSYSPIQRACAYNTPYSDKSQTFNVALKKLGYDVKTQFEKMQTNIALAMDAVRLSKRVETVTISSADANLIPLVNWLKDKGIRTVIHAALISRELRDAADYSVEITEDLLFDLGEEPQVVVAEEVAI